MFETWVIVGAIVGGGVGGFFIKRWMRKLTPIQKYAKMADKAKLHDKAAWEQFEKDIYKKHKEKENKGLTSILW